jgi:hypothetical protein
VGLREAGRLSKEERVRIYTGAAAGEKLGNLVEHGLGIMISPSPSFKPRPDFSKTFCAFDNGAFQAWRRGFPFMERFFWEALEDSYKAGVKLDFIVIPDIVAGGRPSLDFSLEFREKYLKTCANLALAVQDGIEPKNLDTFDLIGVSHIFIGGTEKWKWKTAREWSRYAKRHGKKLHIGRCGTKDGLKTAKLIGADSVDSTSIARNDAFGIVEAFRSQMVIRGIGDEAPPPPCIVNGVIE